MHFVDVHADDGGLRRVIIRMTGGKGAGAERVQWEVSNFVILSGEDVLECEWRNKWGGARHGRVHAGR